MLYSSPPYGGPLIECGISVVIPIVLEGGQNGQEIGLLLREVVQIVLAHVANFRIQVHDVRGWGSGCVRHNRIEIER